MKSTLLCFFVLGISVLGVIAAPDPKKCPPCQIEKKLDPVCVEYGGEYDVLVNPSAFKCAKQCGLKIMQVDIEKCKDLMAKIGLDKMNDKEKEEFLEEVFARQPNKKE